MNYIKSFEYDISDMYQNYIQVFIILFRITKDSSRRLLNFTGSMFRRKVRGRWKGLTSRDSSSRKERILSRLSRDSRKNSRKILSCMRLTTKESWVKTKSLYQKLTTWRERKRTWKMNIQNESSKKNVLCNCSNKESRQRYTIKNWWRNTITSCRIKRR